MLSRRLGWAIGVLVAAVAPACSFDAPGVDPFDAADAPALDALDAVPVDATPPPDACVPDPLGERCNGLDDDCDSQVDETFPTVDDPCDGLDTDLCLDDTVECDLSGAATVCTNAAPDDDVERCNGADDDCDGSMDEDFALGTACDGMDGDVCLEGGLVCSPDGASAVCDDQTPTSAEVCNGADDDCDGLMDEDFPTLGMVCDGADDDACAEGVFACDVGTGLVRCSDVTDTLVETCNGLDDTCDGAIDETFDLTSDPAHCGVCGRTCTNGFGPTTCNLGTCTPTCSVAGSHDCDGDPITGCEARNTDPACSGAAPLGTVRGDAGTDVLTATGYGEAFYEVRVTESVSGGGGKIDAEITLSSPSGANFDLFVTCTACGGATLQSTTTGVDTIHIGRDDAFGVNSYPIVIEVRWASSSACGTWALTVTGNVDTANNTCN